MNNNYLKLLKQLFSASCPIQQFHSVAGVSSAGNKKKALNTLYSFVFSNNEYLFLINNVDEFLDYNLTQQVLEYIIWAAESACLQKYIYDKGDMLVHIGLSERLKLSDEVSLLLAKDYILDATVIRNIICREQINYEAFLYIQENTIHDEIKDYLITKKHLFNDKKLIKKKII